MYCIAWLYDKSMMSIFGFLRSDCFFTWQRLSNVIFFGEGNQVFPLIWLNENFFSYQWELGCMKQVISYADVLLASSCVIGLCPPEGLINSVAWLPFKKRKKIVQCAYNCLLCVIKYISVRKELHLRHTKVPFPLCTMLEVLWSEDFSPDSLLDLYISRLVSPYRIHRFPRLCIVGMLKFYKPVLSVGLENVSTMMGGVFLEAIPMLWRRVGTTVYRVDCRPQDYISLSPTNVSQP